MHVLEIGGSGYVARLINPYLRQKHHIRIFDRVAPDDLSFEFMQGSVLSSDDLRAGMTGIDAVIYLAMGRNNNGDNQDVHCDYAVNVEGVHRALEAAADADVKRVVYTSTMSIFSDRIPRPIATEDIVGDSLDNYGFTKRLGEEVCDLFARRRGLSCISLRINGPVPQEDWERTPQPYVGGATGAMDLARAFDAALTCTNEGFTPIFITGDRSERICKLTRAREVLRWEPSIHPLDPAYRTGPDNGASSGCH